MASAEVRICNRALLRIGQRQISSLDEASAAARACKLAWEDSRDATLEARDWPFARRRATLAALTSGERGGWDYAYTLPDDCIAPRFIDLGTADESEPVPFELENDEDEGATVLLTNESPAELVYTARVTAVPLWTPAFADALAYKLASDLALSIAKRPPLAEQMLRAFELALSRASSAAGRHRKPRKRPPSSFERAR